MTAPTPEQVKEAVEYLTNITQIYDSPLLEHVRTVLAALEEARKDSARYLYAYANLSGRLFVDAALNAPYISTRDVPVLIAAIAAAAQAKGETS